MGSRGLGAAALAAAVIGAGPATAERVFAGSEAAALRCANIYATTAIVMEQERIVSTTDRDRMLWLTMATIDRHVGGSWDERIAALNVVKSRYSLFGTLADFNRLADDCIRRFPV